MDGTVIGRNMQRHRHQEFIRFLNAVEAQVAAGKVVHAIVDNYAAHKHPKVRKWLAAHPRWTFHFNPTSCSWFNAIERFLAILTERRLKDGVFRSVVDLQAAINRFLEEHNVEPKPFKWTADPDKIIAVVTRAPSTRAEFSMWSFLIRGGVAVVVLAALWVFTAQWCSLFLHPGDSDCGLAIITHEFRGAASRVPAAATAFLRPSPRPCARRDSRFVCRSFRAA
jgi:transposase